MNLIRALLLEVEGEDPKPDLSQYTDEQKIYHSALIVEAGLVDGQIIDNGMGYPAGTAIIRLKWDGHEFLDAARDEESWQKATTTVAKAGGAFTISILSEILAQFIKQKLGFQN
jgi:Hypothetical protein (DUF2513)